MKYFNIALRIPYVPIIFFLLISCSSEDKPTPESPPVNLSSIRLVANESGNEMSTGTTVTFTVLGSDGEDYTNRSEIMIDGEAISGNSYQFNSGVRFEFQAKYGSLTSNKITFEVRAHQKVDANSISLVAHMENENPSINDKVTFSILGDDDIDYTLLGNIQVNGEEINGYQYVFDEGGEFVFKATAGNLNSNEITINVESSNYIQLSDNKILREQIINFSAFGDDNSDITETTKFYVNGNSISGNSFKTSSPGTYEVYAITNQDVKTSSKSFEVFIPKRSILFEDYTGTWCGWCPRLSEVTQELEDRSAYVEIVAYHLGDDIMHRDNNADLAIDLGIDALPHGRYNRTHILEFPENEESKILSVLENAGDPSNTSIAIGTNIKDGLLSISVSVISEKELRSSQKLSVFLLQNGIIFPQQNYLSTDATSVWYNMGDPIPDFVHQDVVEENFTSIFGDNIANTPAFTEYTVNYSSIDMSDYAYNQNDNLYNPNNFEVVAFITNVEGEVINVQKVRIGKNAEFE